MSSVNVSKVASYIQKFLDGRCSAGDIDLAFSPSSFAFRDYCHRNGICGSSGFVFPEIDREHTLIVLTVILTTLISVAHRRG